MNGIQHTVCMDPGTAILVLNNSICSQAYECMYICSAHVYVGRFPKRRGPK